MDFSSANQTIWNPVLQLCLMAILILVATIIRKNVPGIKKSMMPTAVIAGFIMLGIKLTGLVNVDNEFMETMTYHFIAIGFIALSLRVPEENGNNDVNHVGLRSGATIVGSYLIQAITGLIIAVGLAYTVMPNFFKPAGILLCLGFGQGPGQANNTGGIYETMWGFDGGRSFGLSIAAAGYICACVVGVIMVNVLCRKKNIHLNKRSEISGSVTIDTFQSTTEIPISESIDRFSMQVALIMGVYAITYFATCLVTEGLATYAPAVGNLVNSLLWGFNFIVGTAFAVLARVTLKKMNNRGIVRHQYQNNYLLSRISGLAFDITIIAGIGSIEIEDLKGLFLPFILMVIAGAVVTYVHLRFVCKKLYKDYYYEGLLSMYGMMTGTISSGILLLREIDPNMKTPAANNLVIGSSFAIIFGAPLLIFIGLAPKSELMLFVVLGACILYYLFMLLISTGKLSRQRIKA